MPNRSLTSSSIHLPLLYLLSFLLIRARLSPQFRRTAIVFHITNYFIKFNTMKFATTILTLALAAFTMATPLANPSPVAGPVATPQFTPPPVDKPNCRDCDTNYTKCRLACDQTCRADICRLFDGFCKTNCGYTNC
ncbi:hypothetical protein IG631_22374 [Alternaria alternata]|nr:hypothetical protein IG631_22374 [Alternaria alternata]